MPIVKIKIADKNFNLSCSLEHQTYIENLAAKLDEKIRVLAQHNRSASLEMLLIMFSLDLLDSKFSPRQETSQTNNKIISAEELKELHQALKAVANKFDQC